MNIIKIIKSSWYRYLYFTDFLADPQRDYTEFDFHIRDLMKIKPQVLEIVQEKVINFNGKENILAEHFWACMRTFYHYGYKKARGNNFQWKFSFFYNQKKIKESLYKDIIKDLKPIGISNFPKIQHSINDIFYNVCQLPKKKIEFFYDVENNAPIPEVGELSGKYLVILSRNVIHLFHSDFENFKLIFLHEAAHIHQRDTVIHLNYYKYKRIRKFSVIYYVGLPLLFLFLLTAIIGYWFWDQSGKNLSYAEFCKQMLLTYVSNKNAMIKLGISFFLSYISFNSFKISFRKKSRIRSELLADIFCILKSESIELVKRLDRAPKSYKDTDTHLTDTHRSSQLKSLMAYCYLAATHVSNHTNINQS